MFDLSIYTKKKVWSVHHWLNQSLQKDVVLYDKPNFNFIIYKTSSIMFTSLHFVMLYDYEARIRILLMQVRYDKRTWIFLNLRYDMTKIRWQKIYIKTRMCVKYLKKINIDYFWLLYYCKIHNFKKNNTCDQNKKNVKVFTNPIIFSYVGMSRETLLKELNTNFKWLIEKQF